MKLILTTPANDVAHIFTKWGKHPQVSNNNIKNPGAYLKGPSFYIVPSEPVMVASAVVFYYPTKRGTQ